MAFPLLVVTKHVCNFCSPVGVTVSKRQSWLTEKTPRIISCQPYSLLAAALRSWAVTVSCPFNATERQSSEMGRKVKSQLLLLWSYCRVWLLFCPKFDWVSSLFPGEWTRNPCSKWSGLVHQPHHTGCGRAQLWRGRRGSVLYERPAKICLRVSVNL